MIVKFQLKIYLLIFITIEALFENVKTFNLQLL